jgi:hypothetical protein
LLAPWGRCLGVPRRRNTPDETGNDHQTLDCQKTRKQNDIQREAWPFQIGDTVRLKSSLPELACFDLNKDDVGIAFQVANIAGEGDYIAVSFPRTFVPLITSSSYELVKARELDN